LSVVQLSDRQSFESPVPISAMMLLAGFLPDFDGQGSLWGRGHGR